VAPSRSCNKLLMPCLGFNCEKISAECEGYSEKTVWRSRQCTCRQGKPRLALCGILTYTSEARKINLDFDPSQLPSMYDGLDTPLDVQILDHFAHRMSWVLTLHDGRTNHYRDTILPMSYESRGLMHGILALSSSHMYHSTRDYALLERHSNHLSKALAELQSEITQDEIYDSTLALIMVFILIHITDGAVDGMYRWHLSKFRGFFWGGSRVDHWKNQDKEFAAFIYEFYQYHEMNSVCAQTADSRLDVVSSVASSLPEFIQSRTPVSGSVISIHDGLDAITIESRALRTTLRQRQLRGCVPVVDHVCRKKGIEVEQAIRDWKPKQEKQTTRWLAAEVYRHMAWVVLHRIMHGRLEPGPLRDRADAVIDEAFKYVKLIPASDSVQCLLLVPLFRLGCLSMEIRHRRLAEEGLRVLYEYSGLGNVSRAKQVLDRVWSLMDEGNILGWDPELVMKEMKYDFLIT